MPYNRPYPGGFQDFPDTTTPINSNALNTMDVGIKTANDQFQTVTTAERTALSPTVGQAVWDSDTRQLMVYINATGGNAWQPVGNTIVCTSTTRPSTPFEGQMIYETDTQRWLSYDGGWKSLFDTDVWSIDGDRLSGNSNTAAKPDIALNNYYDDSQTSTLFFVKARGTISSPTSVLSSDRLGWIRFWGRTDASSTREGAYIIGSADENWSTTSAGARLSFGTTPSGSVGPTERLRITPSGIVVVGNGETATSPSAGTISGTSGSGTNIAGGAITLRGGASTGSGAGGGITLSSTPAGATGNTENAYRANLTLTSAGTTYFGAFSNASPRAATLRAESASGVDTTGADFSIGAGGGTGTASGGAFVVQTTPAGASSNSTLNTAVERLRVASDGVIFAGNGQTATSPSAGIISGTGGSGTDVVGGGLTLRSGAGTGTGAGGNIVLTTAPASASSGPTANAYRTNLTLTSTGIAYFGGATNTSPRAADLRSEAGSGTDVGGASLVIQPGAGTGTGAGGSFVVNTAPSGASSASALNTAVERLRISASGVVTIGNGGGSGTPAGVALQSTFASGTNISGSDLTIRAGAGTGTGAGGSLLLQTAPTGASSATLNSYTTRLTIDSNGFANFAGAVGRGAPQSISSSTYNIGTTANDKNWFIVTYSVGTCTITLPTASSYTGREITIKTTVAQTTVSASSNVVPLAGGSAGTAILAATAGKFATLVSDGTNWVIMAAN